MKALALVPGTTCLELIDIPEPQIEHPDEVKIKVLEVGICGTDRELVTEGKALAPPGEKRLILGHEMLGEVQEVGKNIKNFRPGDLAVVVVRRGCSHCSACLSDRADLCYTENYVERGIKHQNGFHADYIVEQEKFLVKAPESLASCGVLCEPASVVEKAIDEILSIQKIRLPDWTTPEDLAHKTALVVGLGPIGLLACMILRLRGFKVYGGDIVDVASKRVKILEELGGSYLHLRDTPFKEIPSACGNIHLIVEAVGIAEIGLLSLHALGHDGACVMTGVPDHHASFSVEGGKLLHQLVLKNQVILGSVNASKKHWQSAIHDLQAAQIKWPGLISKLITTRAPKEQFKEFLTKKREEEIKSILIWGERKS